jgi:hypothetical protein
MCAHVVAALPQAYVLAAEMMHSVVAALTTAPQFRFDRSAMRKEMEKESFERIDSCACQHVR